MRRRVDCLAERMVPTKSSGMLGVPLEPGGRQRMWEGSLRVLHCFQPVFTPSLKQLLKFMVNKLRFIAANWTLARNGISAGNEAQWRTARRPGTLKEEG